MFAGVLGHASDEEFAERRRVEAEARAGVRVHATGDGLSALTTELPSPVAAAMWSAIDQAAQLARTGGDDRPIGVLRAEAHAALVLRPWDTSRPAMTGHVTVVAPLGALGGPAASAAPDDVGGETGPSVDGTPITAAHLRELMARLGALGVQAPPAGSLAVAITGDDGALLAAATATELRRLAIRGCTTHGAAADCGCPLVGRPAAVAGHDPSAAQERFLRLRDRTCRHPGCGRPAARTDADHVVPYDCGGSTSCENLCCLCRTHHRLKTFARGWRFELLPDGTLRVTTPNGSTRATRPPGLRDLTAQPALPGPRRAGVPTFDPPPF
ncbi:HNH endonuclease signature motif containing protein [Blastococcus sp. SYSU DS0669]